jgi:predicted DCC family thiol-disulfide oxidoreductase YuxK
MKENVKRVLFFDGVCHLCNGLVDFSLPHFKRGELFFAPLQGPTAQAMLPKQDLGLEYVVYLRDGQLYRKSQAIAWLFKDMGGALSIVSVMLRALPVSLADYAYDLVAQFRYKIFGKDEVCRIPTPEERAYFLD